MFTLNNGFSASSLSPAELKSRKNLHQLIDKASLTPGNRNKWSSPLTISITEARRTFPFIQSCSGGDQLAAARVKLLNLITATLLFSNRAECQ
jgi:hypothetical protein